jgi:hypothetical protein
MPNDRLAFAALTCDPIPCNTSVSARRIRFGLYIAWTVQELDQLTVKAQSAGIPWGVSAVFLYECAVERVLRRTQ